MPDDKEHELENFRLTDEEEARDDAFRIRKRPRNLLSRGSMVTLKQEMDLDTGEWRAVVRMSRRKLDSDVHKAAFLDSYSKWGRMGEAAAAAGVTGATIRKAMEVDEDFAEAVLLAEEAYRERLIAHHQDLVFNGTEKIIYDRNGNVLSREQIFPIRLIELELKKHDKGYREKQEVDITHKGGVMIAPAEMNTIDDWEKRFAGAKNVTPEPTVLPSPSGQFEHDEDADDEG